MSFEINLLLTIVFKIVRIIVVNLCVLLAKVNPDLLNILGVLQVLDIFTKIDYFGWAY